MSGGLVALLDDIATLAKLAAASIDDVGAAAGKASAKAAGVVVDDTAVTPRYVQGFTADRELPVIKKIAVGSIRNKLFIILPIAMLLSQFAPWAMPYLMILGGSFLCFEGAEKVYEKISGGHHDEDEDADPDEVIGSPEHEKKMVAGAIRTDLILSAEIMAIALASVSHEPFLTRLIILVFVAFLITIGVYGVVGLIVKMDDIGLHMAKGRTGAGRALGRGLVLAMPKVMTVLGVVGTIAMLWVGGHIVLANLGEAGWHWPMDQLHHVGHLLHDLPAAAVLTWIVETTISAIFGVLLGLIIVGVLHLIPRKKKTAEAAH